MEIERTKQEDSTNKAFERTEVDVGLLTEGEKLYADLNEKPGELDQKLEDLGTKFSECVITLMEEGSVEAEGRLHEIRILVNGIMDAAGQDNNSDVACGVRDMLEGLFGLDED